MKTLKYIFIFLGVHMLFFFIGSLIISMFTSTFMNLITSGEWFFLYSLLIGWWISFMVIHEMNEKEQGRNIY